MGPGRASADTAAQVRRARAMSLLAYLGALVAAWGWGGSDGDDRTLFVVLTLTLVALALMGSSGPFRRNRRA